MKLSVLRYTSWFFMATLFFAACKMLKIQPDGYTARIIPDRYDVQNDTINSADVGVKQFFNDADLSQLIDSGLVNNLDALMALQRIQAAQTSVLLRKAALLPSMGAVASAAQRKYGLYTMDGAGNISTEMTPGQIVPIHLPDYYVGLQASWEVDVWGKLRNKKKAALANYFSQVEGKNLVITEMVGRIAMAYYDLVSLDIELEIIRENISLQNNALEVVKLQKQTGRANELAVQQFEAQLINSKGMELEVQQKITEFESLINFLLGRYPQPIKRNNKLFSDTVPPKVSTGIPSELLKNRPDIRQAEYNLLATKADLKAARAAFYPSFVITGGVGYQAFKPMFLFTSPQSIAYSLAGTLVAPLVNRSAIKSEFLNATAKQQEALYNYQKTILNSYVEVYNEVIRIGNLNKRKALKKNEVDILNLAVETSSDLFKTGRANYLEVLTPQKNVLMSRLELVEITKRQYHSVIAVYKALGGGWK